jgi:hypothetical protein
MKSSAVRRSAPRPFSYARLATALLLSFTGVGPALADPPSGPYLGWEFWTGVLASPTEVEEEYCSGEMIFDFAPDLTWELTGPREACWGRRTTANSRVRFGLPLSGETLQVQSTQPLVSAGGNLYEVYGQDTEEIFAAADDLEHRLATLLMEPTGGDLAILGQYATVTDAGSHQFAAATHLAVSATPAVISARTAEDLEGTSWRLFNFGQRPSNLSSSNEIMGASIWTFQLQAAGACTYSLSSVFPEVEKNGDGHLYFQTNFESGSGADLAHRMVQGGISGAEFNTCSWVIDADGYLVVTSPRTLDPPNIGSQVLLPRLAVSDDNQYLVWAPSAGAITSDPQTLALGYRVAPDMAPDAIDGNFLVHFTQFEYASTGLASSTGNAGSQEFDSRGRGLLRFDSTASAPTPAGESGTWRVCEANFAIDTIEVGYTGNPAAGTLASSSDLTSESVVPDTCAFQLSFDGALRVHVASDRPGTDDDVDATLRGYVSRTEELITLIWVDTEPAPERGTHDLDEASLLGLIGMRYTGDINGNPDGDALNNLAEFQYPLPPAAALPGCAEGSLPIICALPDVNGDGTPDLAAVRGSPTRAEIRSGATGALIRTLPYLSDVYTPAGAAFLPDTDADGIAELAVLAVRNSDSRLIVQIRDLDGSGTARSLFFATGHTPVAIAVIDGDADDDGTPELAVLSTRNSDDRGVIEVKNANGAANTKTLWAPAGYTPLDLETVPDADGNGVPDVAMLASRISDGRNVVQVRNADGAGTPYSTFFALAQTAIDLAVVPDKDADGTPEVAVLSSRNSDGRLLVELKNASGVANQFPFWLGAGLTGVGLEAVTPADGSGIPEVAVLSQRQSDGRILVTVRNAFGADTPRSIFYTVGYTARGLAIFQDADGNGVDEAAVLMTRNSDGRVLVQRRNTFGAQEPVSYFFAP